MYGGEIRRKRCRPDFAELCSAKSDKELSTAHVDRLADWSDRVKVNREPQKFVKQQQIQRHCVNITHERKKLWQSKLFKVYITKSTVH